MLHFLCFVVSASLNHSRPFLKHNKTIYYRISTWWWIGEITGQEVHCVMSISACGLLLTFVIHRCRLIGIGSWDDNVDVWCSPCPDTCPRTHPAVWSHHHLGLGHEWSSLHQKPTSCSESCYMTTSLKSANNCLIYPKRVQIQSKSVVVQKKHQDTELDHSLSPY